MCKYLSSVESKLQVYCMKHYQVFGESLDLFEDLKDRVESSSMEVSHVRR
jgi:hypothetical protein